MSQQEIKAILTLSLLAAFVDGDKHERERAEIKRIAEGLSADEHLHLPSLYQDVLMKRVAIASAASDLSSLELKQLAYEMAVCVCDADGTQTEAEQRFLEEVRAALNLAASPAAKFSRDAEELAAVPLGPNGSSVVNSVSGNVSPDDAELDRTILNASILNGALELLPETLSTMAIIPLQMKLVYRIGQAHGYELDRGHVKDFIATAGVGLTSQFMEQAGRKILGGLLGKIGGGFGRVLANQGVSSGLSFASTYALGHVAKRYYAGGRELSAPMLKDAYAAVMQEARNLQSQYLPAIQDKARTLDAGKVLAMVRGA
jgi:uncharacterized protein (DUF697 family)/tellurite resistance protein